MPAAEIITIGTELLLGEIQDTNTRYLARTLRDVGVDLYRTTVVGDNVERIAGVIREALGRCQIILTTGGLGPTVDDPTREAVARALGVPTVFLPELWEQILDRFQRYGRQASENNRRQAYVPQGAIPVENPVGTAPAFICEVGEACIICMPGVPREMEYLIEHVAIPYLTRRYELSGTIKARVLHAAGIGESVVDDLIGDLEMLTNPTVGLLAHPGQVDVRITAKAGSVEEADQMIESVEATVRERLGEAIYGADHETLEGVLAQELARRGWGLAVLECNLGGDLRARLERVALPQERAVVESGDCLDEGLSDRLAVLMQEKGVEAGLAVSLRPGPDKQNLTLLARSPLGEALAERSYGGPPTLGIPWAVHTALDFVRRTLVTPLEGKEA